MHNEPEKETTPLLLHVTKQKNDVVPTARRRNQMLAVLGGALALVGTGNVAGFSAVALPSFLGLNAEIRASTDDLSWIASMGNLGCIFGNLLGGVSSDLIGRKRSIMLSCVLFCTGWLVIGEATGMAAILVGRSVTGLAAGLVAPSVQVYICEVADPSIRGASGTVASLTVAMGILSAYCIGSGVTWRNLAFACSAVPLFVLLYALILLPESPTWLVSKGRPTDAIKALHWLRQSLEMAHEEFEILKGLKDSRHRKFSQNPALTGYTIPQGSKKANLVRYLRRLCEWSPVMKPFLIGTSLFLFQSFSGIFAISSYMTLIFRYADPLFNEYLQTVCVGSIRLVAMVGACFLVDFMRRRTLLILSGAMMCLANGVLGAFFYLRLEEGRANQIYFFDTKNLTIANFPMVATSFGFMNNFTDQLNNETTMIGGDDNWTQNFGAGFMSQSGLEWVPLTCLLIFMIGYSLGFGIIPWFLMPELMPTDVRGVCCSLGFALGQIFLFTTVKTFLNLVDLMGVGGTFWFYAAVALSSVIFVAAFVPETGNLNDKQIEDIFSANTKNQQSGEKKMEKNVVRDHKSV